MCLIIQEDDIIDCNEIAANSPKPEFKWEKIKGGRKAVFIYVSQEELSGDVLYVSAVPHEKQIITGIVWEDIVYPINLKVIYNTFPN